MNTCFENLPVIPEVDGHPLLTGLDWHSLDTHNPLYPYFAHLYFGGDDLWLEKHEVAAFTKAFVEQVYLEGYSMDDAFDIDEGFEALECESRVPGRVSLIRLIEELTLLVV
ncbi:hypothetical protein THRCLA_23228 [Thraustotheca clavata]|uniref:Uncharacterized protein n=1 Tax=Thraustotheca clavata TaxID=74557 RepID=A0A1V9Y900_9STRA|nr:hypothetical protein THRCLA_23228 [Thraustotheca clavata]